MCIRSLIFKILNLYPLLIHSFKVIDSGKSVHVARTQSDPNVYFFNPENKVKHSCFIQQKN